FIGVLATSIVQSSSVTTSITVGMVAGKVLTLRNAIPIIMGANIGTTVTNTIIALTHVTRKEEFKRAFAAGTVHDFFNILTCAILLPLETFFHPLEKSASFLAQNFTQIGGLKFISPLKLITQPVILILQNLISLTPLLVILSLILIFFSLIGLVKILKSLVLKKFEIFLDKYLFRNILTAFLLGLIFTATVQSSSVTTSLIIPLAAGGLLTLKQIFPYTLGANLGTTVTAILASIVTGDQTAVSTAFAHFLFNLFGIFLVYSLFKSLPIILAEKLSDLVYYQRKIAILYIIFVFFLIPLTLIFLFK
ncbi:MAG: Na/Pi symporter, partial [Patescibacteria group bacterium]